MLTRDDLNQIREIVKKETDPIQGELKHHGKLLQEHGNILQQHSKILEGHGRILQRHGKILRSLKKDQSTMLDVLDTEQMQQRKRLTRVEEHLGLSPVN